MQAHPQVQHVETEFRNDPRTPDGKPAVYEPHEFGLDNGWTTSDCQVKAGVRTHTHTHTPPHTRKRAIIQQQKHAKKKSFT